MSERFVMRVENSFKGRQLIKNLKKSLNKDTYSLKVRYSGPRPQGTNQVSTLKKNATSLRVYISPKQYGGSISDEHIRELNHAYSGLATTTENLYKTNDVLETKLDLMLSVFDRDERFKSIQKTFDALSYRSIS